MLRLSAEEQGLKVGDTLEIIPVHCCAVINMMDGAVIIRDEAVLGIWPIAGRGKVTENTNGTALIIITAYLGSKAYKVSLYCSYEVIQTGEKIEYFPADRNMDRGARNLIGSIASEAY